MTSGFLCEGEPGMSQPAAPPLVASAETIRAAHFGLLLEFRRGLVGRLAKEARDRIPSSAGFSFVPGDFSDLP